MTTLKTRTSRSLARTAAMAFAAAVAASTFGMPSASAEGAPDVLFGLIKNKHVSAGCNDYGVAPAVGDVAVQVAKTMAFNGGRKGPSGSFSPSTENLLNGRGYFSNGLAEMDYFNASGGGSAQDAFDFWSRNGNPFSECGLQQLGVGVWIDGKNFAAVAVFATPGSAPGELPAADQPR